MEEARIGRSGRTQWLVSGVGLSGLTRTRWDRWVPGHEVTYWVIRRHWRGGMLSRKEGERVVVQTSEGEKVTEQDT